MKKIFLAIFVLLNLLASCLAAESQKLIVLLDWFANPNHAPLFVAQEQGYFKQQGLDVELIGPADPSDPPKLVAAGKADIAITYQPQFMEQVEQGLPLIRIGTLVNKPLTCLVVLKNGPIKSIADLKGKHVGYSTGGVTSLSLSVMLKKHGLSLADIKHTNVHYDLTQALLSKNVDAVTGMMRNFELIQLELAGQPGRAFFPEENGVPSYSELILVANKNKLNDQRLNKFLIALQQGIDYLQKHPEESWKAFAKSHPEINDELNKRAWIATLPYFSKHPKEFDKKSWLLFAEFMKENGLITKVRPLSQYVMLSS